MLNIVICLTLAVSGFGMVSGHGMLLDPPARNSMWRYGFGTPENFNDMGLNCGGAGVQWGENDGKCGLCGDSFSGTQFHKAGGMYAPVNRPIAKCYEKGTATLPITVRITAYHKGYFEFILCENNDMSMDPGQDCVKNGRPLTVAGTQGNTRYNINTNKQLVYDFALVLPDVTCTQCILRWKYNTGNSWGCDDDGECAIGNGEQEQFINCADIAILEDCSSIPTAQPGSTTQPAETTTWTGDGDDDDDDEDETETTSNQTPITEPTTKGTTESDDDNSDVICRAAGEYKDVKGMTEWCQNSCLNGGDCPHTHCDCN